MCLKSNTQDYLKSQKQPANMNKFSSVTSEKAEDGPRNGVLILLRTVLFADEMFNYSAKSTNRPLMLDRRNGRSSYRRTSRLTEDPARNLSMSEVINYESPSTDIVLFIRQGSRNSDWLAEHSAEFSRSSTCLSLVSFRICLCSRWVVFLMY